MLDLLVCTELEVRGGAFPGGAAGMIPWRVCFGQSSARNEGRSSHLQAALAVAARHPPQPGRTLYLEGPVSAGSVDLTGSERGLHRVLFEQRACVA